jgi:hypothetical protein
MGLSLNAPRPSRAKRQQQQLLVCVRSQGHAVDPELVAACGGLLQKRYGHYTVRVRTDLQA